jgi:hypothetical protein
MDNLDDDSGEKGLKKHSRIYFKPFNEWKVLKDWRYQLKDDESVECLAMGTGWCAAATSKDYIRIFA